MNQKWLLIDMHMHSQFSKINKPGDKDKVKDMSAKEFVDILHNKKVEIFSITDHNYFSSDYYNIIDSYIKDSNLDMKLINGVELDVYVSLNDGKEDIIHVCFYFDNTVDRTELEKIINNLYKDENGNDKKPHFKDILYELERVNSKIIIIPHGDKDRGIFDSHLIDNLSLNENPEFYRYAMYKIFNAFDVRKGFYKKSIEFWGTNFYEQTKAFNDIIENKSDDEIEELKKSITEKIKNKNTKLNKNEQIIYDYTLKYGAFFAYFTFSDWHNAFDYEPKINNFIFGSIDYAFESFEMATLDPISRVIKSVDTEIEIPNTLIKNIDFKIGNKQKHIEFAPGLNAIVGKRGSGKSLLLAVLKNLYDKNANDGAIKKYNSLNINDITAKDRSNIDISLGSLNSISFLSQDTITNIFENPDNAQTQIAKYFPEIKGINLCKLKSIIQYGKKIQPYNNNYKNLTSNILALKKFSDFEYTLLSQLSDVNVKNNFNNTITEIEELIKSINHIGLNVDEVIKEKEIIMNLKVKYLKIISLYNNLIIGINDNIKEINSKKTNNQITVKQNSIDIRNSIEVIKNNFDILLNLKKFKYLISNFSIENPPVEMVKKNKYLFVTYYDIPENIREEIEGMILKTISRASSIEDIDNYVKNINSKKLNSTYNNITDELSKMLNKDIFKPKKEFYQIKDDNIDYEGKIHTMNELNEYVLNGSLINLTNSSPGTKSVAYLDMLFDLEDKILVLDQPEDNIDNDYISNYLVPNIKSTKKIKQLIFVTHNPSVAVYGDAFNYIYVTNDGENIDYTNYIIERKEDKEQLIKILEGGRPSFSNRNHKFGNILGEEEYDNR